MTRFCKYCETKLKEEEGDACVKCVYARPIIIKEFLEEWMDSIEQNAILYDIIRKKKKELEEGK